MTSLRILLTCVTLDRPSGAVLYTHDIARELLARGHQPFVYSPDLGIVAQWLSAASIGAVNNLAAVHFQPDIIHAQHSLESLKALLHFPRTPAIYVCHDWDATHDKPPRMPRIGKYVAVDETVRDRLILMEGIEPRDTAVIFNGVNLKRFLPRGPLPQKPKRALAISNYLEPAHLEILRAACREHDIALDAAGPSLGGARINPEEVLGQYDLIFAKGRCAWEALAVGAAVMVCDRIGVGPLVTSAEIGRLRRANFGRRLMTRPLRPETIAEQIKRYDAADAELVSREIRATAGVEARVDELLAVYEEVITAYRAAVPDLADDMRAAARFLETWPGFRPAVPAPAPACQMRAQVVESVTSIVEPLGAELAHLTRISAEKDARWRQILREELHQALRATGLRKLGRSIRKRWQKFAQGRKAA